MKRLMILSAAILICGCTDGQMARGLTFSKCKVTLYSGGKEVKTWTSTGKVSSEENSDGYYFKDSETGHMVTVSGNVVIESTE